jgi:hypothetical protein
MATVCGALIIALSLPAAAGVKVTLRDGQVLEGREVVREESLSLLELESGTIVPLATELVIQIKLDVDEPALPRGLTLGGSRTLAGPPEGPDLPSPADQLRVLRESASRFQPGVVNPYWEPTSDWTGTPEVNNNFNPARWYRPPIDPDWKPVDSRGKDVTEFNPARWYRAPIDPTWWPTDGFARGDR